MNISDRVIVALDYSKEEDALKMVETLGDSATVYKVGLELFLNSHGRMVDELVNRGKKVFLDLKFHDIPNTAAMASLFAAKQKCFMFNVHASGGKKMMETVVKKVREVNSEVLIIAVTILTSFTEEEIEDTFKSTLNIKELATNLALITEEAGLNGIVCSPLEAATIKDVCGEHFYTVTPGVRPSWSATNDQERITTPGEAVKNGCDFLVIGRPITSHSNPKEAMRLIKEEIEIALKK